MKEFTESKSNLIKKFETDVNSGLSDSAAESNRIKFGQNTFTKKKPESLLKRIWDAATEPMIIMLIAAGLIALGVNIFRSLTGGEADFLECIGVFAAIALSVIISVVMEGKSAKAFEALSDISSNTIVKAVRNNEIIMLNQAEIVAGDIVLLSAGDKVPADGRLIDSIDLTVDESALTGESISAKKNSNTVFIDDDIPLAERENMLYSGTYITSGNCKMLVTSVGDNTEFGKIAGELGNVKKESTPLQEKLAHLGKIITVLGVIAAAVVFISQIISFSLHNGLAFDEVLDAFITSIVLIVAAVPEGLPTIVAVSLSINIIKLSRQNALVKKMIASETVGCINVICSDKTGTLTENKMTVRAFYNNKYIENTSELSSDYLVHNICLNTTADISETGDFIGNPTECAMLNFYEQSEARRISGKTYHDERNEHDIVCSFPFSSELKHMTTISKVNGDVIA
ncbi:MAG: HAD-IC family P-type ATPase, partial [Clostridiales bacterium]|nr:HAD-IC family P-type ATPase [Clostridiales bacterium]